MGFYTTTRPAPVAADRILDQLEEALTLTRDEHIQLEDILDGPSHDEAAFHMLLGKVAKLPRLPGEKQFTSLDMPSARNLLREPQRYRARALRLKVRIVYVKKLVADGRDMTYSEAWPKGSEVWQMFGFSTESPEPPGVPLMLYSVVKPPDMGEYVKEKDGWRKYPKGADIELAGVFYKYCIEKSMDNETRSYPVVAVWQLGRPRTPKDDSGGLFGIPLVGYVLGAVLVGGYVLIRWQMNRTLGGPAHKNRAKGYRPLRDLDVEEDPAADQDITESPDADPPPQDGQMDPDLAAAVKKLQDEQRKRRADNADHPS